MGGASDMGSGSVGPSSALVKVDEALVGKTLNESYLIKEVLARGAMGTVYRCRQLAMERDVAVKVLLPELSPDPTYGERFFREAKMLGRLTHPNIVNFIDCGKGPEGLLYLVTELLNGRTLE